MSDVRNSELIIRLKLRSGLGAELAAWSTGTKASGELVRKEEDLVNLDRAAPTMAWVSGVEGRQGETGAHRRLALSSTSGLEQLTERRERLERLSVRLTMDAGAQLEESGALKATGTDRNDLSTKMND